MDSPVNDGVEAYARLAWFAVDRLWADSQFRDDKGYGCCHICCVPCSALQYLDRAGALDNVLRHAPGYDRGHEAIGPDSRVNREWMYRMWDGTGTKTRGCGHPAAVMRPDT